VLAQAAGLALLAAVSPTALLVVTAYLGSARPRLTVLWYLAGAILVSVVIGVVALIALRSGHLQNVGNRTPRYGLRTGLGVLILALAAVLAYRSPKRRPAEPAPGPASGGAAGPGTPAPAPGGDGGAGTGMMARLIARPAPATALLAGVLVAPSVTFVAAIQVIATAKADAVITSLGVALVVVIAVAFVWLPFVAFLVFPGPTSRWLATFNGWLHAHGRVLALGALAVAGIYLVINGVAGLAG
jgi:Sap, sulfolipid-1-addressing protein